MWTHNNNLRTKVILTIFLVALLFQKHAMGLEIPTMHHHHQQQQQQQQLYSMNRREALGAATTFLTTLVVSPYISHADEVDSSEIDPKIIEQNKGTTSNNIDFFKTYSIIPDSSANLSPNLVVVENAAFLKKIASNENDNINYKGASLWLGEHHNSIKDHTLQANFIKAIHKERMSSLPLQENSAPPPSPPPMAIGLEQVQIQFQSALDDYISGRISLEEMKRQVDWEKRWFWPFAGYAPIFETAKELQIPLIALNVNSEDLAEVERGGLSGLAPNRLKNYIKDPQGFASFAKQRDFREYVEYVIAPSYDLHERMGLLKTTISGLKLEENMSFRNFFSGRILWDESMASIAHTWIESNPGGLLVGLVGADHVKFKNGIPGRFARMGGDSLICTSVLLNPTLIDTRPSGSVSNLEDAASSQFPDRITLQLRYLKEGVDELSPEEWRLPESTGGVLPLADYIVVS